MCDCFKDTLEKISEKIKEGIPRNAIGFKCDWKGRVLRLDGGFGIGLYVEHEYRKTKKDGTLFINKCKESSFVALSYCPFCGEKISKT